MNIAKSNVVLIGMPATGKSTIGRLIAKEQQKHFVDTDRLLEELAGKPRQQIIDEMGPEEFGQFEEKALLSIEPAELVIATGGSAVYRRKAMQRLREISVIVHLQAEQSTLEERINDFATRGIIIAKGMTFTDLYEERMPLYREFADVTAVTDGCDNSPESTAKSVLAGLESFVAQAS